MASRPLVKVQGGDGDSVALPAIFNSPVRPDIVHFVHTNMAKNRRQPYAVSLGAGHQHSAESWGTGRAVSRIPRVSGGGNSRSGQAAFGNMCRKGRMFNPTRVWRKWHRKINTNQKRYAVASAVAASQSLSLVQARGHRVDKVPELPLVVDNSWESIQKTKDAYQALASVGADQDVDKSRKSRKLRRGAGKMRGRRWVQRRGPLLIYKNDNGLKKAFRGLSGIDLCQVSSLNLLQLAPGGHLGRFIIWTQSAFEALNEEWGTANASGSVRKGYTLPRPLMTISDLARIINSDEIQSKVKTAQRKSVRPMRKKNPLKNFGVRVRLNPYANVLRRAELLRSAVTDKESKAAGAKRAKYQQAKEKHSKRQKLNWERLADDGAPEVADEAGESDASPAAGGPRPKMEHAHDWSKYQSFDDDDCNGKNAPSLDTLQFLQDEKLDLSKPTVLLFFAKYHKPGYNMLPKYNELAKKHSGINFVGAAIDPAKADVEKFMTADKYAAFRPTFPVAWDEKKSVRDAFQVCLMDTLNVVHAFIIVGGKIVWHQDHSMVGATVPTYVDEVDAQLGQLSAGKPLFSFGNGPADSDDESSSEEESDEDEDEEDEE